MGDRVHLRSETHRGSACGLAGTGSSMTRERAEVHRGDWRGRVRPWSTGQAMANGRALADPRRRLRHLRRALLVVHSES